MPHASPQFIPFPGRQWRIGTMTRGESVPGGPDFMVPQWPLPAGVRAAFSLRTGGVSRPPYASFNLGNHVGDAPTAVAQNRSLWSALLSAHAVFLNQVHGAAVVELGNATPDGLTADAAWTRQHDAACTVLVADCLPVLLCDADGQTVSAAHAGWRGLLGADGLGVLEAAVRCHQGADVMAWLGPCIGPRAFEVGAQVRDAFVAQTADAAACFEARANGKWLANLPALARQRLRALGVTRLYGNDGSARWCTVENKSVFYSYRRDGVCGRMAASIWRVD